MKRPWPENGVELDGPPVAMGLTERVAAKTALQNAATELAEQVLPKLVKYTLTRNPHETIPSLVPGSCWRTPGGLPAAAGEFAGGVGGQHPEYHLFTNGLRTLRCGKAEKSRSADHSSRTP